MTTSNKSSGKKPYGTVRIVDNDEVYEQSFEQLPGHLTINVADDDLKLIGSVEELEAVEFVEESTFQEEPSTTGEDGVENPNVGSDAAFEGYHNALAPLAVLPTVAVLLEALLALVFGSAIWAPAATPIDLGFVDGAVIVNIVRIGTFVLALAGTLWMWTDADERRAANADWKPNEMRYAVGGAIAIGLLGGVLLLLQGALLTEIWIIVAGLFLIGVPSSSIIAGPVYLFDRYREEGRVFGPMEE